jgi:DNA-binding PadR family transcriptional regulator
VYRLTPEGTRALQAERRDWQALVSCIETVLRPVPSVAAEAAS